METQIPNLSEPTPPKDLAGKFGKYIKLGTKPVLSVDDYYQKHRKPHIS